MIWFTSDQHFYHKNIIKICRNRFDTIEDMHKEIIYKFNSKVKKDDIVYFLGDFSFGSVAKTKEILEQLNGRKNLILGNHDSKKMYKNAEIKSYFELITDYYELKINGQMYILCHYPFESWRNKSYGAIHLYGHVHDNDKLLNSINGRYHVGVDTNNFYPISIEEVNELVLKINDKEIII